MEDLALLAWIGNDKWAQLYRPLLRHRRLLVSFMTEAELEQWIPLFP